MRDEFWLEDQSPDLFDIEDDQTPDSFGAFSGVLVGPPGPPGPQGPPGADGTVSFDELTPAQKESLRGEGVPAGGTTGQVLAKSSNTDYATRWVDAGGNASLTILSYGHSTWSDFIAAYNSRSIVYCRASSGSDPASGSQTRLAFMAYVNSAASPTSVEFQYYRSVSSHSYAQQGDQVFIYKLTSDGTWTVTVREASTRIVAGTNMSSSYANGTLTLNATGGGGGTSDYDDLTDKPSINNVTLSGNKTAADLGLGTYSKPSGGIPQTDLAQTVQNKLDETVVVSDTQPTATENKLWVDTDAGAGSTYQVPTVAEMEAADAKLESEIGVVITGKRPSMAVEAGQYVIVRNSTISGISDGLYIVKSGYSLSPSVDVTAASLSTWNIGGLNGLILTQSTGTYSPSGTFSNNEGSVRTYGKMNIFTILLQVSSGTIPANTYTNIGTITPHPNARMNTTTQDSYGTLILVDALTDGTVRVYCYNNAMNGTMRTQLCYFAN